MTSNKIYFPRFGARKQYEPGDELAPGGPVGLRCINRIQNGENNTQIQEPPHVRDTTPVMQLRQPMSQLQQLSPPRDEVLSQRAAHLLQQPSLHMSLPQENEFLPVQMLRQPNFQRSTLQRKFPPLQQLRQPSLSRPESHREEPPLMSERRQRISPQEEQVRQLEQARQPSPQRKSSPEQVLPSQLPLKLCNTEQEEHQQTTEDGMQIDNFDLMNSQSNNNNSTQATSNLIAVKQAKKLSKREWRRRQNMHLRRILMPKNALIVLNEMLPGEKGIGQVKVEPVPPIPSHNPLRAFCAELTVDRVTYKGYGQSKLMARNKVAEQAFRDLILKHMIKLQDKSDASSCIFEGREGGDGEDDGDEDEVLPMIQLASFALHKLFEEWECEGHKVPQLKMLTLQINDECEGGEGAATPAAPRGSRMRRPLPANAASMHPCMLLTHMRPDLQYRELAKESDRSKTSIYTMGIDVDGRTYIGKAGNKRDARREAAREACTKHFKVNFAAAALARTPTSTATA